ncbi:DUF445 domain-containing protein [Plastoroseomonas arctica]|uniref:DUF445 domain-containing protein n=1 Tax=Plastoroseomonas arctica TaxID=1509237 RepID=A0AAF1KUI0_9PROT|nr:DUF445 domain-containing protein [Plastoroseomonas arctica]MBR0656202.1 DUF445 domain-containing protein [Plastoroseomonas arctica]
MIQPGPNDAELRASLARHRAFATGLLVVMAGLILLTYRMTPGYWTDLLQAGAKAGLVGGLADWFAVTALFRHPLGLPIPHTAIIPNQQERLGRGLGGFIANHVFTEAEIRRVIERIDLPAIFSTFLADPASNRPAAQALAGMVPRLLGSLEDGRARRLLARIVPRLAGGPEGAKVIARTLRALVEGGRHQAVFDVAVVEVKALLAAKEEQLREAIAARVRAEGGAVVGWLAGAAVARRVLSVLNAELERVEPSDSDLRAAFEAWVRAEIDRLETDSERIASVGRALRSAVSHPSVAVWLGDVWLRLKAAMVADAANPEGRTVAVLEAGLANAGQFLAESEGARARLQAASQGVLLALLPAARERLAGFIASVVQGWDPKTVVEKIELRVGRDLQYVRVNGTLVGFLAGAALFALLERVYGRVAF